jgi:tetratricopeptide (TPR) repeat protein
VLCSFFYLLALLVYVEHCRDDHGLWPGWAVTALTLAALLSKPMAVSLPVVMLAIDIYPLQRLAALGWRRLVREKSVIIALCVVAAAVTVIGQAQVGAVNHQTGFGLWPRCLVAIRGLYFYIVKFYWPAWLSPLYPLGAYITIREPEFWVPLVVCGLVTAGLVRWWKRLPLLPAVWLAFLGWLLPVSGLVQVGSQAAADRFMYLALLAPALLTGGAVIWLTRHLRLTGRLVLLALGLNELGFFACRTRAMIPIWQDEEHMWRHVLVYYPESGVGNFHLAVALSDQGRFAEALPHIELAVKRIPQNPLARASAALVYLKTGHYPAAATEAEASLALDPNQLSAYYNGACALVQLHRFKEALDDLEKLLAVQPEAANLIARDYLLAPLRTHPQYGPAVAELLARTSTNEAR